MFIACLDLAALAVLRVLVAFMRFLPEPLALVVARSTIGVFTICMPRLLTVGRRNLELVFPQKSRQEREKILRGSLNVLARNLLAFARIPDLTAEKLRSATNHAEIREVLQKARERSKTGSYLLVIGHYGMYELAFQMLALLERPTAVLARGFGLPRLDEWCNKRRCLYGNQVFSRKGGFREVVRRLKKKQDVIVLFDQNVKRNHAIFVDLFGIKAATTKAIGLAAIRTGATVLFASCIEPSPGWYEYLLREVPSPDEYSGETEEKIAAVTRALNAALEEAVRLHPDHWFWIHRRFKTRPKGERETLYVD